MPNRTSHGGLRLTTVAILSLTTSLTALGVLGSPAAGQTTHTDLAAPCSVSATWPYAEPLAALDGRTLAQYLADHQAGDRRLALV